MVQLSLFDGSSNSKTVEVKENKFIRLSDRASVGKEVCVTGFFTGNSPLYCNKENGYKVTKFLLKSFIDESAQEEYSLDEQTVVTGYYEFNTVMCCKIKGKIVLYGDEKQISADGIEYIEPETEDDIITFLGSGLVKGVGKKTAEKIVKGYKQRNKIIAGFGLDTFTIIKTDFLQLTRISGITADKARTIHESYMRNLQYQNIMTFLKKFCDNDTGMILTPSAIIKIYDKYQENTIETIKNNPYVLTEIKGFGFKKVDSIARKMGLSPHNPERIKQGILFTMEEAAANGHCYLTGDELVKKSKETLDICLPLDQAKLLLNKCTGSEVNIKVDGLYYTMAKSELQDKINYIERLKVYRKTAKIVVDSINDAEIQNVTDTLTEGNSLKLTEKGSERRYYLPYIYDAEKEVAESIAKLIKASIKPVDMAKVERLIAEFEAMKGFTLEEKQKLFVREYFKTRIIALAGSAGTGKSTIIECLLFVIKGMEEEEDGIEIAMAAPTGKAAKRITEITGYEAKTIHRLLEVGMDGEFVFNSENPLFYNVLIVDETSMLDIKLARDLLTAVDPELTSVVLIGDVKQLPSVGPGNVLGDIINSNKVPTVVLDVIKRQADGSGIVKNATKLINKEMISTDTINNDFFVSFVEEAEKIAELMVKSVQRFMSDSYRYTIDDIQLVCPQKTGIIGTWEMNKKIQALVNPPAPDKKELVKGRNETAVTFRVSDKVIHLTNSYNKEHYIKSGDAYIKKPAEEGKTNSGVFNGEVGKIIDIKEYRDEEDSTVTELVVQYDGFIILYGKDELINLDHAYALTVHKLQGSQASVVIFPVHYTNYQMLSNNLGYTAITRSKKLVYVLAQKKALEHMIKNTLVNKRNTMLDELIGEAA